MLRLEELPFELEGRTYLLRCNMAVIYEVQEAHGGDLVEVMTMDPFRSAMIFLAAMMNDYADEQGWPERWDEKKVMRRLTPVMLRGIAGDVTGLIRRAISPETGAAAEDTPPEAGN